MTTLGLIGSGHIGGTVARLAVAAGYDVVVSNSRGPETLADLVAELGPHARAGTAAEAARAGEVVVVSVPFHALEALPTDALAGRTVLDTLNYYPQRDGHVAALDEGRATGSRLLADALPGARVVKVFNNITAAHLLHLARPAGAADRSTLAIAGDDAAAKTAAVQLLDDLGYDALDVGGLDDSWRFEPGTPAYGTPYLGKVEPFDPAGTPVDRATLAAAVAAAERAPGTLPR